MSAKPKIVLDEFEYLDEGTRFQNFMNQASTVIIPELVALLPTLRPKKSSAKPDFLAFLSMGALLGFTDDDSKRVFTQHQQSGRLYWIIYYALSFLIYLIIGIFVVLAVGNFLLPFTVMPNRDNYSFLYSLAIQGLLGLLGWFYIIFIMNWASRMTLAFVDQYFAEMLCTIQLFHIVIILERNNVLKIPERKRDLLARINYLANKVVLLGYSFIKNRSGSKEWCHQHFKRLEDYIRERERWVIAPQENTLEELRQDFYELTSMFVHGQYGQFEWGPASNQTETQPPALSQRITGLALRILGLATPILIMVFMVMFPQQFSQLGVDRQIVSLVSVAWLLLSVDAILKLGVVERITDLAKAIRDLR